MAVLPQIKVLRHIPIILALFLLFTKDLKEGRIIKSHIFSDNPNRSFCAEILMKNKIKMGKEGKLKKSGGSWVRCKALADPLLIIVFHLIRMDYNTHNTMYWHWNKLPIYIKGFDTLWKIIPHCDTDRVTIIISVVNKVQFIIAVMLFCYGRKYLPYLIFFRRKHQLRSLYHPLLYHILNY